MPVLSQAWKLADARRLGKLNGHEFAVAMHLVHCARQNRTLPAVLPEELSGGHVWVITPAEKSAADQFFAQCDTDHDGFVRGQDVMGLFANSGLPQPVLAQIWALVDTARSGRLDPDQFAVALHLIGKARSGAPVPTALGPEYRPPARRAAHGVPQSPDLLMALEDQPAMLPTATYAMGAATSVSMDDPQLMALGMSTCTRLSLVCFDAVYHLHYAVSYLQKAKNQTCDRREGL